LNITAAGSVPSTYEVAADEAEEFRKLPVKDRRMRAITRLDFFFLNIFQAYPVLVIV
jgi:hypothetical protein